MLYQLSYLGVAGNGQGRAERAGYRCLASALSIRRQAENSRLPQTLPAPTRLSRAAADRAPAAGCRRPRRLPPPPEWRSCRSASGAGRHRRSATSRTGDTSPPPACRRSGKASPGRIFGRAHDTSRFIVRSASCRVGPAVAHRIALAGQQRHGLGERQADHIGVGAHQLHHEGAGKALDGIAAGLAAPFAGGEIGLDILARQALEAHPGLDQGASAARPSASPPPRPE